MPRKRMIDPSFWRDEKIGECTYMERLLFEGLWTFAEDHGVGRASPRLLKFDIFPYDNLRDADIEKSLAKLASLGLILLYEINGQKYYFVINFKKHQTINKPTPPTLPLPLQEHYGSTTVSLPPKIREEKRREKNNSAEPKTDSTPTEPPIITLLLNSGDEYPIYQKLIDDLKPLFPAVDVMQQLREMKAWCVANPTKRKTSRGILKFINGWLSKEQDKGRFEGSAPKKWLT